LKAGVGRVYMVLFRDDDVWMVDVEMSGGLGAGPRRRRSAVERRRIVEETWEAGASVARIAMKYGVNANQVFQWRRLYSQGKFAGSDAGGERAAAIYSLLGSAKINGAGS
jgi:transposase-like protein